MTGPNVDSRWNIKIIQPRWPWSSKSLRPADILDGLVSLMLERGSLLEDVNYAKVVPNHYVVEVNPQNYAANYQPIQDSVVQQWAERLVAHLMTTNSRYGRKAFRFAAPVRIELRSGPDLSAAQVRILARIDPGTSQPLNAAPGQPASRQAQSPAVAVACLELPSGSRRWPLVQPGVYTLGRDPSCEISFDLPEVRARRLVSSRHAYLRVEGGQFFLCDGDPNGKPSLNGTYLNGYRVSQAGQPLNDGDTIILASEDPNRPRPDTPGAVVLIFRRDCA